MKCALCQGEEHRKNRRDKEVGKNRKMDVEEGEEVNEENEENQEKRESADSKTNVKGNDRRAKLEEYLREKKKLAEKKRTGAKPVFRPGGGAYKDAGKVGRGGATSPFGNSTLSSTRNTIGGLRRGPSSMNLSRAPSSMNLTKSSATNLSRVSSRANLTKIGTPSNRSVMGKRPLLKPASLKKNAEARKPAAEEDKPGVRRSARSRKAPEVLAGPGGSTRAKKNALPAKEVQPSSASSSSSSSSSSNHTIPNQPVAAAPSFAPGDFKFSLNIKPQTPGASDGASTPKDGEPTMPRDFSFSVASSINARPEVVVEEEEEHMEDEVFREEDEDEETKQQDQTEEEIDQEIKRSVRKNRASKRMEKVLFPGMTTMSVDSQDSNLSATDEISFKPNVASSLTPIGIRSSRRKSLLEVPPDDQERQADEETTSETKTQRGRRRSRRVSGVQPDPSLSKDELARTPARRAKERSLSCDR